MRLRGLNARMVLKCHRILAVAEALEIICLAVAVNAGFFSILFLTLVLSVPCVYLC